MIAQWRKATAAACAGLLALAGLAACRPSSSSSEKMTLTVWASQEDQADQNSWLQTMEAEFQKRHPEYAITWQNQVVASADAATIAKQDPTVAADVYTFASDQLGTLVQAGAVGQMSDDAMAQLKKQTAGNPTMVDTVTASDGNVYGMPLAGNTWFMYYRKSKFTEQDLTSLDAMLAKGKVSFPLTNSWYLASFYLGAGGTLFGPNGTDAKSGVQFGGETGAAVTNYLVDLRANPNFVNDTDGSGLAGLKSGKTDVVFTGNWDAATVRENLGDDWGVAKLPSFTLNGKQVQMKSFAGSTVYGWNPYTKHPVAADQFAAFLSSTYSQKAHYTMRSVIPSDTELSSDAQVAKDPVAAAQMETIAQTSVVQPSIPEMNNFWSPCENFGKSLYNKEVTHTNAAELTEKWMQSYKSLM
ncbi:extracellular solute-binding protein [Alloscardovia macacae]|uniref:ABC transporter substrate-binding protein n=1 Tax=Alloscardovia macacae TaxID=1160091 RepID=A0A261F713_9BIFI|nr:extracellular solute-binding protein [Alloscardovia macacae]OZG54855.1 ABC transporter substrate-binding protein [Alloscardovia macacae]